MRQTSFLSKTHWTVLPAMGMLGMSLLGMSPIPEALQSSPAGISKNNELIRVQVQMDAFATSDTLLPGDKISLMRKSTTSSTTIGQNLSVLSVEMPAYRSKTPQMISAAIIVPKNTSETFHLTSTESDLVVTRLAHQ